MFERFTDLARRVMVLAQEEARRFDHDHIGTEHLLLGLLAQGEGVGFHALEACGVSLAATREQARTRSTATTGRISGSPPFTERAKKAMEGSLREALSLGHTYIGTEHVLLGLLRDGDATAARMLVALGVDLADVRQHVLQILSGSAAATTEPIEPLEVPGAPLCPHCGADLEEHVRYRELMIGDEAGNDPRMFLIVYCGDCGRALAFKPEA
jgi:ATP-dependent Clp protease ATP-binding subunit ClpC